MLRRIVALDVGEKRVGVAVSDPLGYTAQPKTVLDRKPHQKFLDELNKLAQEYEGPLFLLGLPRRLSGEKGPEAQRIMALAHELKSKLGFEVELWDEWFSTVEAERALLEADMRRDKRKKVIDQTAAALILDGYLSSLKNKSQEPN